MCGFKNMFAKLNEFESGNIAFGDTCKIPVKRRGKILIPMKMEGIFQMSTMV